jgi:hypothetical protein
MAGFESVSACFELAGDYESPNLSSLRDRYNPPDSDELLSPTCSREWGLSLGPFTSTLTLG